MKTKLLFAVAALALASCSSDELVDGVQSAPANPNAPMGFAVNTGNMGRADLQDVYKNFGVWAYKANSEGSFTGTNLVMDHFLVGYDGTTSGYKQPTYADYTPTSLWFYDQLGNTQYTYDGTEGYYKASETDYMSNKPLQYLKYWDYNFGKHYFYAYTPYLNAANGTIGFDASVPMMTFPTMTMGKDAESAYMYATNIVASGDYGNEVPLTFHRLNAKLNIKVYGNIPGYKLELIDYSGKGIEAVNAKADATAPSGYVFGKVRHSGAPRVTFAAGVGTVDYVGAGYDRQDMAFALPTDTELKTTRAEAIASSDVYYLLPNQSSEANDGYIFYISYRMTALDNSAVSEVYNAGVFVSPDYTNWKQNSAYTYVFKITDKAGGQGDPTVPSLGVNLQPIVFDGMEVADYEKANNGSEWVPGSASNPSADTPFNAD